MVYPWVGYQWVVYPRVVSPWLVSSGMVSPWKVYVWAVYPWVVSLWMGGSSTGSLTTRGQGAGEVLRGMAQQCCTRSTGPGERAEGEGLGKKAKGFYHGESTLQKTIDKCSITTDTHGEKHPTATAESSKRICNAGTLFLIPLPSLFPSEVQTSSGAAVTPDKRRLPVCVGRER